MVYQEDFLSSDVWTNFAQQERLTFDQADQFAQYYQFLLCENEKFNITTITSLEDVIRRHFMDSLSLRNFVDIPLVKGIADVGSGGGFPGVPLKIIYPRVPLFLIEVSQKKALFLTRLTQKLGLEGVTVITDDWRTFLLKKRYSIDLFVSRAALKVDELSRVFSQSSLYRDATLVYWASSLWQPEKTSASYIIKQENYDIGDGQQKKLVFMKNKK